MPSKLGEKAGTKLVKTREIHVFDQGGIDPETGEEYGHNCRVFMEWNPEDPKHHLSRMMRENPSEQVSCVEMEWDPKQIFTPAGKPTRKCLNCLSLPLSDAAEWIPKGFNAKALDVSGTVKSFYKAIDVASGRNDETVQMLRDKLEKALGELESIKQKINTPKDGGEQ